ncbi:oxygen oxidoreductase [Bisporella sp. PMI_857]|nr:oxygen oxidoreductase [Bisporella sp. PMI_857]
MSPPRHDASIIIVGAGTWGCSIALHFVRRGYSNITVLDPYELPSPIAAGNDVNKIVEEASFDDGSDDNYVWRTLRQLATKGWTTDPVFIPFYHNTGYIQCAHTAEGLAQLIEHEKLDQDPEMEWLDKPAAFRKAMPEGVLTGDFPGWKGGFKRSGAGWVFARGALMAAYEESKRLGVKFITGSEGNVTKFVIDHNDIVGVEIENGKRHLADTIILANRAQAPSLLDFKDQLRPTAWTLAHIKMTPEERELYKNLPVLFNIEKGFFMEPDAERGELKICDEHPGYTNFIDTPNGKASVPFARQQIPLEAEERVRDFLRDTMPQLTDRPFSFARVCWCADTPDRHFLIDRHPQWPSLVLAVGGSGHGFMHISSIGGLVADTMEGVLDERLKEAFRWRPETAINRDWQDVQGRRGGPNRVMDFKEVKEWTSIPPRT